MGSVGGVEVDDVFYTAFGDKAKVVYCEVAVGVNNTITLVVENIGESKEFKKARFSGACLADDIDVARAVATKQTELVVYAAEICHAKGGDVFVGRGVSS